MIIKKVSYVKTAIWYFLPLKALEHIFDIRSLTWFFKSAVTYPELVWIEFLVIMN